MEVKHKVWNVLSTRVENNLASSSCYVFIIFFYVTKKCNLKNIILATNYCNVVLFKRKKKIDQVNLYDFSFQYVFVQDHKIMNFIILVNSKYLQLVD